MNSDLNWAQAIQHMQETFGASLALTAMPAMPLLPALPDFKNLTSPQPLAFDDAKMQQVQALYLQEATQLWNQSVQAGSAIPPATDRRFANAAWNANPVSKFSAAAYMLNARALMGMAEAVQGDAKTRARVRFAIEQAMAASAPSNFMALNAEAQQKAIDTHGQSIGKGIENLLHDMQQGHVSMTDESLFEVGKNVAMTDGAVVFENDFFQLLEYKPLTATVFEK
ncbi:MAG: class I poly(R)-hydroxyalkanoic acid synthase, partial [Chitinophagaceae bacterium]|nr:class I poly(R)-hydroxyalkanoic acid synthase [Polaromonas sp.]